MMHASKYQYFSCGKPEARSLKLVIDGEENVENKGENTPSLRRSASLCFTVISRSEPLISQVSQEAAEDEQFITSPDWVSRAGPPQGKHI